MLVGGVGRDRDEGTCPDGGVTHSIIAPTFGVGMGKGCDCLPVVRIGEIVSSQLNLLIPISNFTYETYAKESKGKNV